MNQQVLWIPQHSPALDYAARELAHHGFEISGSSDPSVTHILLPVPCRLADDVLKDILASAPDCATVLGGFLHPATAADRQRINLLEDPYYQAENAMITAYCALRLGADALPVTWERCPVLILGWGRIGKCLSRLLRSLGAEVTVAARKDADLALCRALGYHAKTFRKIIGETANFRVIFNTVPAPVLSAQAVARCRDDRVLIELASVPGMEGPGIIDGRGLPGKMAPESAGSLIARTVIRLC